MNRREFLQGIAAAAAAGLPVASAHAQQGKADASFYDGVAPFGNVSLFHFTDCHAQLMPIRFREPNVNLGIGAAWGQPPHLVGEALLKHFGIRPGTREAHAFTYLEFERAAKSFGMMGGFAHLATLVRKLKSRGRMRCCSTAATRGRAPPPRCGRKARTWSTRRSCWAST